MNTASKSEVSAAVAIVVTVGQVIRAKKEIPSGELYALVMGKMNLQTYGLVIDTLKRTGAVTEENHLLKWVGK